jgi:hypothetical protein
MAVYYTTAVSDEGGEDGVTFLLGTSWRTHAAAAGAIPADLRPLPGGWRRTVLLDVNTVDLNEPSLRVLLETDPLIRAVYELGRVDGALDQLR